VGDHLRLAPGAERAGGVPGEAVQPLVPGRGDGEVEDRIVRHRPGPGLADQPCRRVGEETGRRRHGPQELHLLDQRPGHGPPERGLVAVADLARVEPRLEHDHPAPGVYRAVQRPGAGVARIGQDALAGHGRGQPPEVHAVPVDLGHDLVAPGQPQAIDGRQPARPEHHLLDPGRQPPAHMPVQPVVDVVLGHGAEDRSVDPGGRVRHPISVPARRRPAPGPGLGQALRWRRAPVASQAAPERRSVASWRLLR
jgi:hypothetical protein